MRPHVAVLEHDGVRESVFQCVDFDAEDAGTALVGQGLPGSCTGASCPQRALTTVLTKSTREVFETPTYQLLGFVSDTGSRGGGLEDIQKYVQRRL